MRLDLALLAAVLVLAMAVLLLAGMGAGEISRPTLQASDLEAVGALADQRTVLLTVIAHVLSGAGSALLIVPVTVAVCATWTLLVGLAVRPSHRPWATDDERTDGVNPELVRRTGETGPSAPPVSGPRRACAHGAATGHGRPSDALDTREFA